MIYCHSRLFAHISIALTLAGLLLVSILAPQQLRAQLDQGAITGVVTDQSGAAIPNAAVVLTNTDTGLVLRTQSNASGNYVFSPIKIGNYQVSASAPGFTTVIQEHVRVDVSSKPNVNLQLAVTGVTQGVVVSSAPPLLETQSSSVGQVISAQTINDTPLNGRNWVYIAQLSAGVVPGTGSRGAGTGDFNANGQRAEQNDFILDGVDNNVNVVDFTNGASYVVRPTPDALAEFKIETGNYSAEYGHSAGAVINASTRSGTNQVHGSVWEYFRNDALDAANWNSSTNPEYRQNQFGAALGLPIIHDHLFFFGDTEADRIVFGNPIVTSVPTLKMRSGDFSELLQAASTGSSIPTQLYVPNSGGTVTQSCNGQNNVFCSNQLDPVAHSLMQLFPLPNVDTPLIVNNYQTILKELNDTVQWDARLDYNISSADQFFTRYSYFHSPLTYPSPLGVLDGGTYGSDGTSKNLGENFVMSETHIFTPNLVNEFRIAYNWGSYGQLQSNSGTDLAAQLGLGGIPFGAANGFPSNGGLPLMTMGSYKFGSPNSTPTVEGENVYQIIDNMTRNIGNHSIRFGVALQSIRFRTLQPASPRGNYTFTGLYTSKLNATFTGFPAADFITGQINSATITEPNLARDARWYRAAYVQDDWRATPALTLNLGLRYEFVQPYREVNGYQANFVPDFRSLTTSAPTAQLLVPAKSMSIPLAAFYRNNLTANNVVLNYVGNPSLVNAQKLNFAPRVGLAYTIAQKLVIRSGFGIFYGGLENRGGATNLLNNYPFQFTDTFAAGTCKANACPSNGLTLSSGFSSALATGLLNFSGTEVPQGTQLNLKTPYVIEYNLSVENQLSANTVATLSYVGNGARHLQSNFFFNSPNALAAPSVSAQSLRPFPLFGNGQFTSATGVSNYNAFEAKLERRLAGNLSFLVTYTYAHSLDDAPTALTTDTASPNPVLVPQSFLYSNSPFDVRHRFTVNGHYTMPWGAQSMKSKYASLGRFIGGWETSLTFVAQTGNPFSVSSDVKSPTGITGYAYLIRSPFTPGGAPDPSNPGVVCASKTRTPTNWYNPCAFANPLPGTNIPTSGAGSRVTDLATVLQYVGGRRNIVYGPGYERINLSLFKDIPTLDGQKFQLRADVFNVLNTPAYDTPSITNDSSNGGAITDTLFLQNFTPDARFIQLSAKYIF